MFVCYFQFVLLTGNAVSLFLFAYFLYNFLPSFFLPSVPHHLCSFGHISTDWLPAAVSTGTMNSEVQRADEEEEDDGGRFGAEGRRWEEEDDRTRIHRFDCRFVLIGRQDRPIETNYQSGTRSPGRPRVELSELSIKVGLCVDLCLWTNFTSVVRTYCLVLILGQIP